MKDLTKIISVFESLAANAHHKVSMNDLLSNESEKLKEICRKGNSELLRNYFDTSTYFADSIKVAQV